MGASLCSGADRENIRRNGYLLLRVRCSDGQQLQLEADFTWTVHELMIEIMHRTGVHRVCQRLTFRGRWLEADPNRILHNIDGLAGGVTVHVTILRDRFPEKLGPFAISSVPIKGIDFCISETNAGMLAARGTTWSMQREVVEKAGVHVGDATSIVVGQLSPAARIVLTEEERDEAMIPYEAQEFCWSYPVPGLEAHRFTSLLTPKNSPKRRGNKSAEAEVFFKVGGFLYLDRNNEVLKATALMPPNMDEGGLQFCRPKKWEPLWTDALIRDGRFHEIKKEFLNDIGAVYLCWLKPGEVLLGGDGRPLQLQPEIPLGGFVYLFYGVDSGASALGSTPVGSFMGSPTPSTPPGSRVPESLESPTGRPAGPPPMAPFLRRDADVKMDRYFAIASADEFRRRPNETSAGQPWSFLPWRRGRDPSASLQPFKTVSEQFCDLEQSTDHLPVAARPAFGRRMAPSHWTPGRVGLVEVLDERLRAKFQALLDHTHKQFDNWTLDRGCHLHGVNGCELACACQNMERVPTGYTLVSAWRNQNPELWAEYCAMRAAVGKQFCDDEGEPAERVGMKSSCPPFDVLEGPDVQAATNEWRLFHGSSTEACQRICRTNFNLGCAGMGATWREEGDAWGLPLYGFGASFAERITKADEFVEADPEDPDMYSVLLCRVLGGRTYHVAERAIDPHVLASEVLDGPFHSVLGGRVTMMKKPYQEVTVYDKRQIYPEYLLDYRRRYLENL